MTNEEKKLRDRDKRLRATYGITLEQYNQILEAQDGKCATCGRPATAFSVSLAVDHEHFKVVSARCTPENHYLGQADGDEVSKEYQTGWIAVAKLSHEILPWRWAKTKDKVIELAKNEAMPYSVRGLLCPGRHGPAGTCCNRNMGRIDNPVWLRSVLRYLEDPPARKVLTF